MRGKDEKHAATLVPFALISHHHSRTAAKSRIFRVIRLRDTTARSHAGDVGHPQWAADGRHALRREKRVAT